MLFVETRAASVANIRNKTSNINFNFVLLMPLLIVASILTLLLYYEREIIQIFIEHILIVFVRKTGLKVSKNFQKDHTKRTKPH